MRIQGRPHRSRHLNIALKRDILTSWKECRHWKSGRLGSKSLFTYLSTVWSSGKSASPIGLLGELEIKKKIIYLFLRDRERGRDTGRGRSRLPAGSRMGDSISGPRDHALSRRQMLNHWAPQAPRFISFLTEIICYIVWWGADSSLMGPEAGAFGGNFFKKNNTELHRAITRAPSGRSKELMQVWGCGAVSSLISWIIPEKRPAGLWNHSLPMHKRHLSIFWHYRNATKNILTCNSFVNTCIPPQQTGIAKCWVMDFFIFKVLFQGGLQCPPNRCH